MSRDASPRRAPGPGAWLRKSGGAGRDNPTLDLSRNLVPIYLQLITVFRRFIATGQWPVDEQIPTLEELSAQFGVARATVRQAIGFLEREGLLARYRRHGTFVIARPQRNTWYTIPTDWKGALRAHAGLAAEWLESRRAEPAPGPYHGEARIAASYQLIRRRYRHDGVPLLVETAFLERRLYRALGRRRLNEASILELLDTMPGLAISRAEQTIYVGMSDSEISTLLNIPLNSPLAVVRQSVCDADGALVFESEGFYRGDAVRVVEPMPLGR